MISSDFRKNSPEIKLFAKQKLKNAKELIKSTSDPKNNYQFSDHPDVPSDYKYMVQEPDFYLVE
jgi:hypothetical protein